MSHHKNKINLHPLHRHIPLLKTRSKRLKTVAMIKGEHMKNKTRRMKMKVHRCLIQEFTPPFYKIIVWT
jgi:hypothetical protein